MKIYKENRFGKCVVVPTPEDYGEGGLFDQFNRKAINSRVTLGRKAMTLTGRSIDITTYKGKVVKTSVSFFLE